MKQFLKHVLATVVGFVVVSLLVGFFSVFILMGVAMGSSAPSVEKNTVLVVNLDGELSERAQNNPFGKFMGSPDNSIGLDNLTYKIMNLIYL